MLSSLRVNNNNSKEFCQIFTVCLHTAEYFQVFLINPHNSVII